MALTFVARLLNLTRPFAEEVKPTENRLETSQAIKGTVGSSKTKMYNAEISNTMKSKTELFNTLDSRAEIFKQTTSRFNFARSKSREGLKSPGGLHPCGACSAR